MSTSRKILKQASLYSICTQMAQIITLLASVFSRRFLGPLQTGIWSTLQIVVDYAKYSQLGIMNALLCEIPLLLGQGKNEEADRVKDSAATFALISSGLIALTILIFSISTRGLFRPEVTVGLILISILIILQRLNNVLVTLLRCYQKFEIESRLMVISAFVNAILVAFLSFHFKIYGFIGAMILSFLFNIIFMLSQNSIKFRWGIDGVILKGLIRFGFPLMVLAMGMALMRNLDQIFVVRFLGFEAMGWYSIAVMVAAYLSNYPTSLQIVFVPNFQEIYGRNMDPRQMQGYLSKSLFLIALTMALLVGCAWVAVPYAIRLVLPKFEPGIAAMQILCFHIFFLSLGQALLDAIVNIKKHYWTFPVIIISLIVSSGLQFLFITKFHSIAYAATAAALASTFYFMAALILSRKFFFNAKQAFIVGVEILLIAFWMLLYFLFLNHQLSLTLPATIVVELGSLFVYALPIIYVLNRRFKLMAIIKEKLLKGLAF